LLCEGAQITAIAKSAIDASEVWRSFAEYAVNFLVKAAPYAPVGRNP
jgi:sarcosine oxidase gamma subunit